MNERIASKYIMTHLRKAKVHCQRVESVIDQGIPDINCCFHGFEFWIEMKCVAANKVKLRAMQKAWHAKRMQAGGIVLVIAFHKNTEEFSLGSLDETYKDMKEVYKAPKKEFVPKLIEFLTHMAKKI